MRWIKKGLNQLEENGAHKDVKRIGPMIPFSPAPTLFIFTQKSRLKVSLSIFASQI